MFQTRPRTSVGLVKRQRQRKFRDVTASGDNIPLSQGNWLNRWCTLPLTDDKYFKELYELEVRDDDVFLVTFPKCGTTWIQEATWLLTHNLDFNTAQTTDLQIRSVFMEFDNLYNYLPLKPVELSRNATSPRVLKSHFHAHLLPKQIWEKKSKIVYCARNPKDTAVSFYHFHRGLGTWEGSMDEFVEDLINNDIMYTPYWEHLMDFWHMRHEENVFFTTYEQMKRDLRKVLVELNRFLGNQELNEADMEKLLKHLSFENMKTNTRTNPTVHIKTGIPTVKSDFQFMRRGIVGSFKDELTAVSTLKLDEWIEINLWKYNVTLFEIFGEL